MPQLPISAELSQVLEEARDIAEKVGQPLGSGHLLLAMFVLPNAAQTLLSERSITEDTILAVLRRGEAEDPGAMRELTEKAAQLGDTLASRDVNCMHVLLAMTRVRASLAWQLLTRSGGDLTRLRTSAMGYLTGAMPRRFTEPAPTDRPERAERGERPERAERPDLSTRLRAELSDMSGVGSIPARPLRPQERAPSAPVSAPRTQGRTPAPRVRVPPADLPPLPPLPPASFVVGPLPDVRGPLPAPAAPAAPKAPAPDTRPPYWLDPARFPLLTQLGKNMTEAAAQDRVDAVVGRDVELEHIIDILGKRRANNPCLVGEPGVGKSALVEGLAARLLEKPNLLPGVEDPVVVELDVGGLVAGTALRGAFSERMQGLKEELRKASGRIIVFMDEIHTLMGAGSAGEGPLDGANELKTALARGEFPCIGATTAAEYKKHIEKDPALARRFVAVHLKEPDTDESLRVLEGVSASYTAHHQVEYTPAALRAAVNLSDRFIHDRCLPGKALDVMDLAGSRARRQGRAKVEREDVARVIGELAGVPLDRLLDDDKVRFLRMEAFLSERVVGHREAMATVAAGIRRAYAGFAGRRPMGSFLFLGPTGVGKTEMVKALADFLFGAPDALIRLDMSEYAEAHAISRMLGSPPGYVGHDEGGQLTDAVRRRPYSIVLLDEIDKAHPEILLPLLQVLDEGRLTDARGRTVSFRNTVVIMTTNAGGRRMDGSERTVGFGASPAAVDDYAHQERQALEQARRMMPPELWGRIDEKILFRSLLRSEVAQVARQMLMESARRLTLERGIRFSADDSVVEWLMDHGGFDAQLGARPMRQAVQRHVEGLLASAVLAGRYKDGDEVRVVVENGALRATRGNGSIISGLESVSVLVGSRGAE